MSLAERPTEGDQHLLARSAAQAGNVPSPRSFPATRPNSPSYALLWEDRPRGSAGTSMRPHRAQRQNLGLRDRSHAFQLMSISGSRAIPRRGVFGPILAIQMVPSSWHMPETAHFTGTLSVAIDLRSRLDRLDRVDFQKLFRPKWSRWSNVTRRRERQFTSFVPEPSHNSEVANGFNLCVPATA